MDDLELEERIRTAIDQRPAPERPLRARSGPAGQRVIVALSVIAIALLVGGAGYLLNSYRASVGASAPDPRLPPLSVTVTRDDAIATVRRLDVIGRVDRVDAKLMSFDEYTRGAGPVRTRPGNPVASPVLGFRLQGDTTRRYVWVVAVSGEVWPSGRIPVQFGVPPPVSPTAYPPYRWGMFLIDADSGGFMVVGDAGIGENWPPAFSALPAHPAGP
jgi:hypothetical protein